MMLVSVSLISRHLLVAGSLEVQDLRISLTWLQKPKRITKLCAATTVTYTFQITPTGASGVATGDQGLSGGGEYISVFCRVD